MTEEIETPYEYFDIFADDQEPITFPWRLYFVRLPRPTEFPTGSGIQAWVAVDKYAYCELRDWYYFGLRDPHRPYHLSDEEDMNLYNGERAVWEWLSEWELVELRPIGPEDSEYFATSKLTGDPNDDRK